MIQSKTPILLLSGSRAATERMLDFTERMVLATLTFDRFYPSLLGARIIVGDAVGVDDKVARVCQALGIDFTAYGITDTPRNSCWERHYERALGLTTFPQRDEYMAERCTLCVAIWNGISQGRDKSTGTIITYKAVQRLGKPARLVTSCPTYAEDEKRVS